MEVYKNVKFHITAGFLFILLIVVLGVTSEIISLGGGFILGAIVLALAIVIYLIAKRISVPDEHPDPSGSDRKQKK